MPCHNLSKTEKKLNDVRQILRNKHLDAALIFFDELNVPNAWYPTGYCCM